MLITAELSLYPLDANYKLPIRNYIDTLKGIEELEVRTHALSTELFGEYDVVMQAVQKATRQVFEQDDAAVLVAKYLNRDRR
ncbi:MAG: thiamine-binding protein [Gammaproteobacteria bacterium]|nr:thiamine-binding protein [Gammaproteobacteria bacterium]NND40163.1 hypothetical protein [Pseudomonadales bacterium]MBT8151667.1 thiamine-binding protein [Gammaproteobacteria bacterium]NNL11701.1 hypothetical protein [Pseudomonadales bacterium]NNM12400.1 hypothetical protein [Pseudomonadales bacterium]